jgi:hypothetical protein
MVVVRCTKKLLDRIKPPSMAPVESVGTNVLGDWYANLLIARHTWLIVAVSEKTLLPVVLPAAPFKTMAPRLAVAVGEHLRRLGVASERVDEEVAAMVTAVFAKTASRRVLGSLIDLCGLTEAWMWPAAEGDAMGTAGTAGVTGAVDTRALEDKLATVPCGPLGMGARGRVTVGWFGGAIGG